ncbi:MAG: hypothetical protein IPL75_20505 [Acidobacteria bacterium]|nr:hypothetical protein [Acidobacteriota bacterium]
MRLLSVVVALVAALPGLAMAQPPGAPRVEVGVQASVQNGQAGAVTWSPRLTLSLAPLTAVEGSADFRNANTDPFGTRISSQAYTVHWRQTLFTSGRWRVFGVLGVGGSRRVMVFPEQIINGRDGPEIFPPHTYVDRGLAVQLGPAVQFEAAPWLALRGDLRLDAGDNGGLRGMLGAVVPVGRYRRDVPLAEGRDSLKNGIIIGASTGALGGGALFTWAANAICESDPCSSFEGVAFLFGAASGAAVGGLLGAMIDSVIPGKQKVIVSAARKAVHLTVAWP